MPTVTEQTLTVHDLYAMRDSIGLSRSECKTASSPPPPVRVGQKSTGLLPQQPHERHHTPSQGLHLRAVHRLQQGRSLGWPSTPQGHLLLPGRQLPHGRDRSRRLGRQDLQAATGNDTGTRRRAHAHPLPDQRHQRDLLLGSRHRHLPANLRVP